MKFYLGTHQPHWLREFDVSLFVSRTTLEKIKKLPKAKCSWALDSGGFTEVSRHGGWRLSEEEYVEMVRRFSDEIGLMDWAAPMDWMCEPFVLAKTGLTVDEHQIRTVVNFMRLRILAPEIHWAPVLQGWELADYERCFMRYQWIGIDLRDEPIVGIGSVCRRQGTKEIKQIVSEVASWGVALHGFGIKTSGLRMYSENLVSADSMSWSFTARRQKIQLPGCTHLNCANCRIYALMWREQLLRGLGGKVV